MRLRTITGALLGLSLCFGAVGAVTPAAQASPDNACSIAGRFTWQRPGNPGYPYGLSRFTVTSNNCRDRVRAFIACVYIGPHAAEITRIDTGNVVVSGVSQVRCAAGIGVPGWTFNHSRGAGFEFYGSGGPGWHLHWLVS